MFCRQSTVPWCLKFIPIFLHGTYACTQGQIFDFSMNLYALEHAHVVQIWIMQINALKTQLMYKNVKRTRKIAKFNTTLLLFYVDTRKFWKAIRGNRYRFVPKGGKFPTETIRLVVRSSGLWEAYTQTCPKWDKKFTTACDAAPW